MWTPTRLVKLVNTTDLKSVDFFCLNGSSPLASRLARCAARPLVEQEGGQLAHKVEQLAYT